MRASAVKVALAGLALAGLAARPSAGQGSAGSPSSRAATNQPVLVDVPFVIYQESSEVTHPYTTSGWMGNIDAIEIDDNWTKNPHRGKTCIRAEYKEEIGWGGVAWLHPENNWGKLRGGYNLSKATRVSFYARGETGSEVVEFKVGVRQDAGVPFEDTAHATTGKIRLTTAWKHYAISLTDEDLSRVISGFVWVTEAKDQPVVFYLDDIVYE
ncbi:MAG: hypothetical protein V1873_05230 [Verrucomicrobiota bacterium]